ncbi:hypothetical protein [Halobaculum gomorrense]|uniref:Uncharacterized protein n=1 Tax=Halobaculum gomorrense TaxID=43928 RepID=A0A1M5QMN6_9EURY|nr:hypothetical protein [Halobaculum gomorrense]SHH15322.1 hypothetical protein SAMN05443636_1971 [Halobaculum gomorrense]
MTRQDATDGDDAAGGATADGDDERAFGGSRLPIVGGTALVGAVAGNLVVQVLVAGGTLPPGADATMLPVFAGVALLGLFVLVGSFLRR